MSAVQLVTLTTLKTRLAAGVELAGVDNRLVQALAAAHFRVEAAMDSALDKASRTDVFYMDKTLFGGVDLGGMLRLRLKQAWVESISSVKVGDSPQTIDTEVDSSTVFAREDLLDRGYLTISSQYDQQYLSVEYTAGFDNDNKDGAPAWLIEAVMAFVPSCLKITVPANEKEDTRVTARLSAEHALAVMAPYNRSLGFALRPLY